MSRKICIYMRKWRGPLLLLHTVIILLPLGNTLLPVGWLVGRPVVTRANFGGYSSIMHEQVA